MKAAMFSIYDTDAMYSTEVRRLIEHYFHHGFQNRVVVDCVNIRQAVTMNPSTLKRRLRDYGLSRRSVDVSDHGYRTVWHSLAKIESSHPCAKRKAPKMELSQRVHLLQTRTRRSRSSLHISSTTGREK